MDERKPTWPGSFLSRRNGKVRIIGNYAKPCSRFPHSQGKGSPASQHYNQRTITSPTAYMANARVLRAVRSADFGFPSPRWKSTASVLLAHDETINVNPSPLKLYKDDASNLLANATTCTDPRAAKRAPQPVANRL